MEQLSLVDRFYAFVISQDPERKIDHGSFRSCAVGEFYASEGIDVHDGVYHPRVKELRSRLPTNVNQVLSRSTIGYPVRTYGGLQRQIADS